MEQLVFSKMSGAGNDFIIVCREENPFDYSTDIVRAICDRKQGVGADGFILLSHANADESKIYDVRMDFFNCDGSPAEVCGNGLRCATLFAVKRMAVTAKPITFQTGCGILHGELIAENSVRINMLINRQFAEYSDVLPDAPVYYGISGVPHAVTRIAAGLDTADIVPMALQIRHHQAFAPAGTNVDFVEFDDAFARPVIIRTFERGVEAETLACGTGVCGTATALHQFFDAPESLTFRVRSGDLLRTQLQKDGNNVREVLLTGPAVEVFRGTADMNQFIHF